MFQCHYHKVSMEDSDSLENYVQMFVRDGGLSVDVT